MTRIRARWGKCECCTESEEIQQLCNQVGHGITLGGCLFYLNTYELYDSDASSACAAFYAGDKRISSYFGTARTMAIGYEVRSWMGARLVTERECRRAKVERSGGCERGHWLSAIEDVVVIDAGKGEVFLQAPAMTKKTMHGRCLDFTTTRIRPTCLQAGARKSRF